VTSYRARRLDGSIGEFHQAVDLLEADTVPESYYLQVMAGRVERGPGQPAPADKPTARPGHGGAERRTTARQSRPAQPPKGSLDGQGALPLSA
jgi:hypothetical protein